MMTLISAFSSATSVPGRNGGWVAMPAGLAARVDHDELRPRWAAFLMKVAATGWFTVGLAPMTMMTSDCGTRRTTPSRPPTRSSPSARRRSTHDRAGCSDRRCWSRTPAAPASGTGTPLRSIPSPTRIRRAAAARRVADSASPAAASRALRTRWPGGNGSTGWPDRPGRRRVWARPACGRAASSTGSDGGYSRTRNAP